MERGEGPGIWLSAENVKHTIIAIWDAFLSLFRPMFHFISDVSGSGWLGAAIVFSIFFSVFLIRAGARSGIGNIGAFAGALEYYATWGLAASGGLLALILLEWALLPLWTVFLTAAANSLTGGEPGLLQLLVFLAMPTPQRTAFLGDVARFYDEGHSALPLGLKGTAFIAVAFGTMWIVARGMGRLRA